jgi:guanidinopropionase
LKRKSGKASSKRRPDKAPKSVRSPSQAPPSSRGAAERSKYRPPRSDEFPRFAGVPSFLRLPIRDDPETVPQVDVVLQGVPFDGGTSFRPGARFGPRAVREASALARSFSAALGVDIFDELKVVDGGDVRVSPHDMDRALEATALRAEAITRSGAIGGFIGGDQTVTLGALRGIHRAKHKSVGLLHIDAHSNASPQFGPRDIHHSSAIRKLVEEGLVRPEYAMQVGIRGPYSSSEDLSFALASGFEVVTMDEVRWDLHAVVSQVRKLVRHGALYVSVDVSSLDPSCAPGTGFPSPGGMNSWELQQILRALVGADIVGFDVVEIAPPFDPTGITAMVGVTIVQEILSALADSRRSARPAPSSHHDTVRRGKRLSP